MSKFLGNRWGKIGLMLFICFVVHGFIAASSYAVHNCCQCADTNWYDNVSTDAASCTAYCSGHGGGGIFYTARDGYICGSSCSNSISDCNVAQKLCDLDTNEWSECLAMSGYKCVLDPNPTITCGTDASGITRICNCDNLSANGTITIGNILSTDECICITDPYAK